jgi:hypothetical protein
MVLIAPKIDSFGEQLSKGIGQGLGQGIGNSPDLAIELLKGKREREARYGSIGQEIFSKLNPNATPQELANFFEESSKLQKPNEQPGEMFKRLAQKATDYKNKVARAEEYAIPENALEKTKAFFRGEEAQDISEREKLSKRSLSGLDKLKQREILRKKHFQPEEIAERISPLSEAVVDRLERFPSLKPMPKKSSAKRGLPGFQASEKGLDEEELGFFRNSLSKILQEDPDADLLLLRKGFEKKGVNWREFRDAIDSLQEEGQVDFSNHPEHSQNLELLYTPPRGGLKKILHGLKLIGR